MRRARNYRKSLARIFPHISPVYFSFFLISQEILGAHTPTEGRNIRWDMRNDEFVRFNA